MAQEVTPLTTGAIKQNVEVNGGLLIRPQEPTTVYSTGLADKDGNVIVKAGEPMEVHAVLAEKLIKSGKATEKAPAKADKK